MHNMQSNQSLFTCTISYTTCKRHVFLSTDNSSILRVKCTSKELRDDPTMRLYIRQIWQHDSKHENEELNPRKKREQKPKTNWGMLWMSLTFISMFNSKKVWYWAPIITYPLSSKNSHCCCSQQWMEVNVKHEWMYWVSVTRPAVPRKLSHDAG